MERNIFDVDKRAIQEYKKLPQIQVEDAPAQGLTLFQSNSPAQVIDFRKRIEKCPAENLRVYQRQNQQVLDELSRAPKIVRTDPDTMLEAIRRTHNAYEYVDKSIRTEDFIKKAIETNPAVYSHLTREQKQIQSIADTYMKEMLRQSQKQSIGGYDFVNMPPMQIDRDYPFSVDKYSQCYDRSLSTMLDDPSRDIRLSTSHTYMQMMRAQHQDDRAIMLELEKAEKSVWKKHEEEVLEISRTKDELQPGIKHILQKASHQSPEMAERIAQNQEEYWLQPENLKRVCEADRRQETRVHRVSRTKDELERDNEDEKILKEAEQKIKRIQRKEAELAYLKQSSIDYIRALEASGQITPGDAAASVARIESIPNVSQSLNAMENLAKMGDITNDFYNINDLNRAITSTSYEIDRGINMATNVRQEAQINQTPSWARTEDYDVAERLAEREYSQHHHHHD